MSKTKQLFERFKNSKIKKKLLKKDKLCVILERNN